MRGHQGRLHDMRAVGDSIVSVSGDRLRRHTIGGLSKATVLQEEVCMHLHQSFHACYTRLADLTFINLPHL